MISSWLITRGQMLHPSDGWRRDTAGQALTACPPLLRHAEQRGMDARGKELCCAGGIGACCSRASLLRLLGDLAGPSLGLCLHKVPQVDSRRQDGAWWPWVLLWVSSGDPGAPGPALGQQALCSMETGCLHQCHWCCVP